MVKHNNEVTRSDCCLIRNRQSEICNRMWVWSNGYDSGLSIRKREFNSPHPRRNIFNLSEKEKS